MKFIRILVFSLFLAPVASFGASNEFMVAAQLLAAAKSADIQQVQALVNNGADVNFVDSTGLSIVCTALMNNDVRAAQILQMYGADASNCDRQIKRFNNKNKPKGGGGLFSGLSSAQGIGLAAAGAAVVVGGLFLLTDVFDPGNDNDSANGSGDRPSNNPNENPGGGDVVAAFTLPYGPGCDATTGVCDSVDYWSPDTDDVRAWDFAYMKPFNYLMMAFAYNSMARGYEGQEIVRVTSDKTPFNLGSLPFVGGAPDGGKPVAVATVTANGVNATGSLADGWLDWADADQVGYAQSQCTQYGKESSQCTTAVAALVERSRKFYNRESLTDLGDLTERTGFDFSGHGTVFGSASEQESMMAKVVAGWTYNRPGNVGDYLGFVPNGQLAVYRTGGGLALDAVVGASNNASGATDWGDDDTFSLGGVEYKITLVDDGTFTAVDVADESNALSGTKSGVSLKFVQNGTNYEALFNGNVNSLKTIDLMNYSAMLNAANLNSSDGAVVGVIANVAQNPASVNLGYLKMSDFKAGISQLTTDAARMTSYMNYIDAYYNLDASNDSVVNSPGMDAKKLYTVVGSNQNQIIVNSVGAYEYGVGTDKAIAPLDPTFENFAPAIWTDLEHLFASVVAVQTQNGTSSVGQVSGYTGPNSTVGKVVLSDWVDGYNDNGTPDNTSDDFYDTIYASRKCGDAGLGLNGVDPWCFAAPGKSSEMAVASMAGAIASVQSAFSYLDNDEVFALLALTADGAYLGTNPDTGKPWAATADSSLEGLVSYLKGRYELPGDYSPDTNAEYLKAFKEVFGYGLINLERATKPGTSVYYYNGDNIVSTDGNAFWRAATNTVFRPSSVLNLRGATIRAPYFDVLENVDGSLSLPRVWENEFALGVADERGLYMGDVLGDLKTRRENTQRNQIGAIGLTMAFSERVYNDNLNGLDNLALDYVAGRWNFGASYQHYFTDGVSRFSGLANPVLGLMSNAVVSDVAYNSGKWSFGARAFSGAITDEGLLENDPTVSSQYMPARLGLMQGGATHIAWTGDKFKFTGSVGNAHESDTLLGAQTGGVLNLGDGDTMYVDAVAQYRVSDMVDLMARATFAQTKSNARGEFVMGLSDVESNAFAFGANIGNLEFSVSRPLAITDGALQYAYAEYDVVKGDDNKYELNIVDTHVEDLSLKPEKRETRFMATYRHQFGEFTDGAIGFIYRVNPNHTDDFGNESVFMLKMSHRLGI